MENKSDGRDEEVITIRTFLAQDENFIFSTWLKGLYFGNPWFREIDKTAYLLTYRQAIKRILYYRKTAVKIACLKEDPEIIIGYAVFEGPALHWVHVKKEFRKMGVAKQLIPKTITTYTHLTKIAKIIKPKHIIFNPFYQGDPT